MEKTSNMGIDLLIRMVLPIPILHDITASFLKKNKGIIYFFILGNILFFIAIFANFSRSPVSAQSSQSLLKEPHSLIGYRENGFFESTSPFGSPIGGNEQQFMYITAFYHDADYFKEFGMVHDGLDIIPNASYYKESEAYQLTRQIILIATMSGTACSFGNPVDGYSVTIESATHLYKVLFHHQSLNFIPLNTCTQISRGTPIGIMGQTGHATGIHVHYGTYTKVQGAWKDFNPLPTL